MAHINASAALVPLTSGADAEALDGGMTAWIAAGYPAVPAASLPSRDAQGRTVCVTRARPKIDPIACP